MSHLDDESYDNMNDNNDYRPQKNMTVKSQIRKIEETMAEIRKDCDENKKNAGILKGDLNVLGHKTKEKCNELSRLFMEDLQNLEKEFKRTVQSDKTETEFFKQQLHGLTQDKTKIKQNYYSLDSRLKICETDVGVGFYMNN